MDKLRKKFRIWPSQNPQLFVADPQHVEIPSLVRIFTFISTLPHAHRGINQRQCLHEFPEEYFVPLLAGYG
jgi:hypothetical protein